MQAIVDLTNSKGTGTFKFQYSNHFPVHPNPGFIPKDKRLAEQILGYYFCEFRKKDFGKQISNFSINNDDTNKQPDVLFIEDGAHKGLQITQLQFIIHQTRKAVARQKSKELADQIAQRVSLPRQIIINIFPCSSKDNIPLMNVRKGKSKIEKLLVDFILTALKNNMSVSMNHVDPIWIRVDHPKLSPHFKNIVLNPVPRDGFPRFYGNKNVFVNYDFDDVSFSEQDMEAEIKDIYQKKNGGSAEYLLIWADDFEMAAQKKKIAETIYKQFFDSSFDEVFLMTFENNLPMFLKSLQLFSLKGPFAPSPTG